MHVYLWDAKEQVYNRLVGWPRVYSMEKEGAGSNENRVGRKGVDKEPKNIGGYDTRKRSVQ